jgi:hypothetical protein
VNSFSAFKCAIFSRSCSLTIFILVSRTSSRDWWLIERVAGDFLASWSSLPPLSPGRLDRVIASLRLSAGQGRGRFRQCTGQLARVWPGGGLGLDQGGGGTGAARWYPRHPALLRGQRRIGAGGAGRGCRSPRARSRAWGGCTRGVDNYLLVKLASSGVLRVHEPLLEAPIKMAGTRAGSAVRPGQRRGRRALSGGQDRWPAIRSSAYLAGRPGSGIPAVSFRSGRHSRLGCHGWVVPGRWGRIPDGGDARAG